MSTITKERAQEIFLGNGPEPTASEERELARIALASLEAEQVEWRVAFTLDGQSGSDFEKTFESQAKMNEVISLHERAGFSASITPLYTAPPVSVSVPECFKRLLHHAYGMTMGHDWNKGTMAGHHRTKLCQAVEECRAAMFQGAAGNSPVIPDGWVILPAEPTQAMMNAWLSEVANWRGHAAGYRAMIAAAPKPEA